MLRRFRKIALATSMDHNVDTESRWAGVREVAAMAAPIVLGSFSYTVMRFVDDGPMRAAPRGAQFLQPRQQSGEEGRAVVERDSEEVDDDVLRRLVEQFEDLVHVRLAAVVSQDDRAFEGRVIAFGVNDAELIAPFGKTLEKSAGQSRFPDA